VLLAAGRGTRMRADATARLDDAQERMAVRGLKSLIPFDGTPFIAYVLAALADAGYIDVCVVVRPGADPVRSYLEEAGAHRLRLHFVIQEEPRGTAHALLAAERFADAHDVALINADNFYPVAALRALRARRGPGLVAFGRAGLLRGHVTAERLAGYALVETGDGGILRGIIEKPAAPLIDALGDAAAFSMTCWRFGPRIFAACRAISGSARGELELPDAVLHSIRVMGERYEVVPMQAPVLDLSRRADVEAVAAALRGRSARF
jgi:dTDP-glucose pyrophosphorylase